MGTYSDMLFGPEAEAPTLEPVQAPVERPAPVGRPGESMPRQRVLQAPRPSAEAAVPEAAPRPTVTVPPGMEHVRPYIEDPRAAQQLYSDFQRKFGVPAVPDVDLTRPQTLHYLHTQMQLDDGRKPQGAAPSAVSPTQPPTAPSAPGAPRRSYSDEMFGADPSAPAAPKMQTPPSAEAEPDAKTWLGRRAQDVLGKQDKRYTDLPTIAEALINEKNNGATANMAMREWGSWLTAASDKDMTGVYKGVLGKRFVRDETDANGYPVVVYKDQDGKEAKAYVNKPGLDMQDAMRGVGAVAPFVRAGKLVGTALAGAPLLSRMAGHVLAQGATSVAQDAAGVAAGVSEMPTLGQAATKAGIAAAGGAAGELLAAPVAYAWRKLVTEPRYFNKATGELTEQGIKAAEAAGIDAKTISSQTARQFSREMARTGDPIAATSQVAANEFKIRRTPGELTKDQDLLLREQQVSAGNYGRDGAEKMQAFRKNQAQDIENAVTGMADEMAPGRAGQPLGKADHGANVRANTQQAYDAAKEFETKAWKEVPEFKATEEMLAHIDTAIPQGLKQRGVSVIEEGLTPAAKKMSDMLESFQAGEMPKSASKFVGNGIAADVDIMRRRLLAGMEEAATPTDKRAAKAIYDSFNDWIVDAARMSGDPMIATQMVTARTLSREIHEAFDGVKGTAGEKILGNVLKKADSAEAVIDALFSGQTKSAIKSGSIDALERLKTAYSKYLEPEAAKAAWGDIKLAYFQRAVMKNGAIMEPKALSNSLKNMIASQRSVLSTLGVSKEEMSRIGRLAGLLDDVARRNPNTSWSGVTMSQFLKDIGGTLFTMIGGNSIAARVLSGPALKPFQEAHGRALAGRITGAGQGASVPRLPPPPFAGPAGGLAASDRK